MKVLIVEQNQLLGGVWQRHLERNSLNVELVPGYTAALSYLHDTAVDLIILSLTIEDGSPLDLADYVNYRYPDTPVIFVGGSSFFSDGSIFQHVQNARAMVAPDVKPDDLAAMVDHYTKDG
jgi:DNA-binding NtrC family response regulator